MKKGIIFFTDNKLNLKIAHRVQANLKKIAIDKNIEIVSASLKKMDFGDKNVYFPSKKPGILTMFTQIMSALDHSDCEVVFFCEHDVLYHPSHFDFVPPTDDAYYYNTNVWKLWLEDKVAIRWDNSTQVSGLAGTRDLLWGHYHRRVAKILQNQIDIKAKGEKVERDGFSKHMGYEPGGHMYPRGVDEYPMKTWESEAPNVDIRHGTNFTNRGRYLEEFHNPDEIKGWTEAREIPGWGSVDKIIKGLV